MTIRRAAKYGITREEADAYAAAAATRRPWVSVPLRR